VRGRFAIHRRGARAVAPERRARDRFEAVRPVSDRFAVARRGTRGAMTGQFEAARLVKDRFVLDRREMRGGTERQNAAERLGTVGLLGQDCLSMARRGMRLGR
jgi:hypothetical protein